MMGGGFFGSGASSTDTQSTAVQNTQYAESGAAPLSLAGLEFGGKKNNVNLNISATTTDHGAVGASFGVVDSAIENAFLAVSDTAAFSYDGVSKLADVLNTGHGYNVGLTYDLANINKDITQDVLASNSGMSLAVLQSSENFADKAALLSLEHSLMSGQAYERAMDSVYRSSVNSQNVALDAMDSVYRSSVNSQNVAIDAMSQVGSAYNFANQGLLALSADFSNDLGSLTGQSMNNLFAINSEYMDALGAIQSDALAQVGASGQAAQNASMKALDYVFESTKTAEERIITDSTKWLIGGVVAVAALFVFPSFAKAFK